MGGGCRVKWKKKWALGVCLPNESRGTLRSAGAWIVSNAWVDQTNHWQIVVGMIPISSVKNPRVKEAARLRDARHRQKQGRIIIDGARELARAMAAGISLHEIFICPALCHTAEARDFLSGLSGVATDVLEVTPQVFEKLAFGARAEGVLGVAAAPDASLERLVLPNNPLVAVIEGAEKPGNIGAIARTADAAGLSAMVVADGRTDLYNPNAIRASLGTLFSLPVAAASTAGTIDWLRSRGLRIFAARVDGNVLYTEADFCGPSALVLGSESQGLTDTWSGGGIVGIRLPMLGVADSLNVSATAAVLFYEARRQRGIVSGTGQAVADGS